MKLQVSLSENVLTGAGKLARLFKAQPVGNGIWRLPWSKHTLDQIKAKIKKDWTISDNTFIHVDKSFITYWSEAEEGETWIMFFDRPQQFKSNASIDDLLNQAKKEKSNLEEEFKRPRNTDLMKFNFIKHCWEVYNKEKFQGRLPKCNFELTRKVDPKNMRVRGMWIPTTRTLRVSPNIFNAKYEVFREILLHEMAHAAVTDLDHVLIEPIEKGHGPLWKKWMVHIGLDPRRFDPNTNTEYMPEGKEKEEAKGREAIFKELSSKYEKISPKSLRKGLVVGMIHNGKNAVIPGVILGPAKKKNEWLIITNDLTSYIVSSIFFVKISKDKLSSNLIEYIRSNGGEI